MAKSTLSIEELRALAREGGSEPLPGRVASTRRIVGRLARPRRERELLPADSPRTFAQRLRDGFALAGS